MNESRYGNYRTNPTALAVAVVLGFIVGTWAEIIRPTSRDKVVHVTGSQSNIRIEGPVATLIVDKDSFGNYIVIGTNAVKQ